MPQRILVLLAVFYLVGCSEGYGKKDGKWAWYDSSTAASIERPVRELENAKGELTVLSQHEYAKTADNVYFRACYIRDADPDSFELLEYPFAKDKAHVFCGSLSLIGASPVDFKILHSSPTAGLTGVSFEHIRPRYGKHPNLLPKITGLIKPAWSTDGEKVFYGYGEVTEADVKSFEPLNRFYAKDSKQAYFGVKTLKEANPKKFKAHSWHAEDGVHTYDLGKLVTLVPLDKDKQEQE